jgi:L-fucose mutarotase
MLKGIDPLLNPDMLHALCSMGHGDDLIIADANFPAASISRATVLGRPLRMDCDTARALAAVLSVMPVDTFVADAAARMEVVGKPEEIPPAQEEALALLRAEGAAVIGIERFAFYERARRAFAVVQTRERRFYGCLAVRKGVIAPDPQAA